MTTQTTKLNLISPNSDSDPFQRSDFETNWSLLDGSPGAYICTSGTRPTWGVAQKGRMIVETDTFRQLVWSGDRWREPTSAPGVWTFTSFPAQTVGPNTSVFWTLGTVNVLRPSLLTVIGSFNTNFYPIPSRVGHWAYLALIADGTQISVGAHTAFVQWHDYDRKANSSDYRAGMCFGSYVARPGSHTIGARMATATSNQAGILMQSIQTLVMVTSPNGGLTTVD